jgi:hypothetical protein
MKSKLVSILAVAALALPSMAAAQFSSFAGTVMVDMVEVNPGASFEVHVRLVGNDLAIAGMQLPLKFSSPHLTLDSVSYAASIKPSGTDAASQIDNISDTVSISFYPDHNVFPVATASTTGGILATLHFTVSSQAPDGVIAIDSVYHGDGSIMWSGIGFADADGLELKLPAAFIPGEISVLMPTAVDDDLADQLLPKTVGLAQNYPNPFNPSTVIEFALPRAGHVKLEVFNILGQRAALLIDGPMTAGVHQVEFDAAKAPSGIYFYRLATETKSLTKKMILIK